MNLDFNITYLDLYFIFIKDSIVTYSDNSDIRSDYRC